MLVLKQKVSSSVDSQLFGLGLLDSKKTTEIELLEPGVDEYKNFLDLSISNLESHSKFLHNINVSNNN